MKSDKQTPMTDRQAGQLDRLGVKYDRSMTIHHANRLANEAIVKKQKDDRPSCGVRIFDDKGKYARTVYGEFTSDESWSVTVPAVPSGWIVRPFVKWGRL